VRFATRLVHEDQHYGMANIHRSVFLATKHAARGMLKTSESKPYPAGSIVATASVAGLRSNAGTTDYSASKAAVISIMQTAAYQLTGQGIRCNAVCPGLIETGMTSAVYEAARQRGTERKIGQLNPLQRGGIADEIARVVASLPVTVPAMLTGRHGLLMVVSALDILLRRASWLDGKEGWKM
jgi:NAD(P)-dependent dehydrogenase (short-subunit alcohol dehydrogenase family)